MFPSLEPGDDFAYQTEVAAQHPQVEAIGKEDEESLQGSCQREQSQPNKTKDFLEAEQHHQETEYP